MNISQISGNPRFSIGGKDIIFMKIKYKQKKKEASIRTYMHAYIHTVKQLRRI